MVNSQRRELLTRSASHPYLSCSWVFVGWDEVFRLQGRVTKPSLCAWNFPSFSTESPASWETL